MAPPPPQQSAASLLARAAAGDGGAWSALVEAYTPRVYALLMSQCRDRELAEELTQATFVKVVTRIGQYQEAGRFEAWLFRIAVNGLRDEMRRRQRQASPMDMSDGAGEEASPWAAVQAREALRQDGGDSPLERLTREEELEQLRRAVAQLPPADQEVLRLRHTAGLSFPQIAQALDQPLGTVLARAHRALGKLRKLLAAEDAA